MYLTAGMTTPIITLPLMEMRKMIGKGGRVRGLRPHINIGAVPKFPWRYAFNSRKKGPDLHHNYIQSPVQLIGGELIKPEIKKNADFFCWNHLV